MAIDPHGATKTSENVNVILDAPDNECRSVQTLRSFGEEGVKGREKLRVAQVRAAIFGGENEVDVGGGERLRHGRGVFFAQPRWGWIFDGLYPG